MDAPTFAEEPAGISNVPISSSTKATKWATSQDWENVRAQVSQLYEDKPLKEIMEIMAKEYGHHGT